jgi:uncharacterized membrane protein
LLVASIAGAAVLAASVAGAAQSKRDAAVEKCFAMARNSGDIIPGGAGGENRAAVYKDCMRKAGYRP